jgi:hypothetical protein
MFTHKYKTAYIAGYFNRPECRAIFPDGRVIDCSSYRAAQLAITKVEAIR